MIEAIRQVCKGKIAHTGQREARGVAQQGACEHTREYSGSKACSASISAATPPCRCTSAMACSASVVFPLLSGPYTCSAQSHKRLYALVHVIRRI